MCIRMVKVLFHFPVKTNSLTDFTDSKSSVSYFYELNNFQKRPCLPSVKKFSVYS